MVYRLLPVNRFNPESNFGMEDLKSKQAMIGCGLGLVVGILFCWLLASRALKADASSDLYKWFVKVDKNGKLTVFKNWQFWLVSFFIVLMCATGGIAIGHNVKDM
jgi:hypothetical protein